MPGSYYVQKHSYLFWSFKEAKTGLICSFQRYMGVWALKVTQLAHYPNFYVKHRTTLEVTGALFISSEKGTKGGSLSYNKTKLFIGRADPLSFGASLDSWCFYFTKCSWNKPPHALSERWDGADRKVPMASLIHPSPSSVGEQDSLTLHLRTPEENGTLG